MFLTDNRYLLLLFSLYLKSSNRTKRKKKFFKSKTKLFKLKPVYETYTKFALI